MDSQQNTMDAQFDSTENVEELIDENGETFKVMLFDGLVMPVAFLQMGGKNRLKYVQDFPHEDGDVLLCSYPKTGTHWVSHLLHFLRHEGPISEVNPCSPYLLDLPVMKEESTKGARNLCTHFLPKLSPKDHLKPGRKIVLAFRSPKDTAVSHYYALKKAPMFGGFKLSWNSFINYWMEGKIPVCSYFDYYNSWQRFIEENADLDIHVVNFEDLKSNGVYELRKLSKYLGLKRSDEQLKEVLERCSLGNLKADVESGRIKTPLALLETGRINSLWLSMKE